MNAQTKILEQIPAIKVEVAEIADRIGAPRTVLVVTTVDGFVHHVGDRLMGERIALWKATAEACWAREGIRSAEQAEALLHRLGPKC